MLGFRVINQNLANSVHNLLKSLKLPSKKKIKGKYFQIEVSGKENLEKYLKILGSKNNRILCKFSYDLSSGALGEKPKV